MRKLSLQQQRFCDEYIVDMNGTQAAIRAGYSPSTARSKASQLLTTDNVSQELQRKRALLSRKADISAERVIGELARIGFSDIRGVVKWASNVAVAAPDERSVDEMMEDGPGVRSAVTNQVELIDSDQITDDMAAAISEISQTDKGGLKVKLHDKRAALVDLGRHLGIFTDGVNVNLNVAMGLNAFYGAPATPAPAAPVISDDEV